MAQVAWPRGLDPDRLRFTRAVYVIKRKMPQTAAVPPERLTEWRETLLKATARGRCVTATAGASTCVAPAQNEQLQRPLSRRTAAPAASAGRRFASEQYRGQPEPALHQDPYKLMSVGISPRSSSVDSQCRQRCAVQLTRWVQLSRCLKLSNRVPRSRADRAVRSASTKSHFV